MYLVIIPVAKAENGEVKSEKPEVEGKRLGVEERMGDGAEAAHSQSSGHSRRSGRTPNYDKIAFQRQNLRDLKLLGSYILFIKLPALHRCLSGCWELVKKKNHNNEEK